MPGHTRLTSVHILIKDASARPTHLHYIYSCWILDAKVARPPHATWYVRRVSSLPALQALTWRIGAPAHLCYEGKDLISSRNSVISSRKRHTFIFTSYDFIQHSCRLFRLIRRVHHTEKKFITLSFRHIHTTYMHAAYGFIRGVRIIRRHSLLAS